MNNLGKITFDLNLPDQAFTHELYARWDSFFATHFERIADEVLAKYDQPDQYLEIDRLELDLGILREDNWETTFPLLVREKLEEALLRCLQAPGQETDTAIVQQPETIQLFQLLTLYLLHGTMPWNAPDICRSIPQLFLTVLRQEGNRLRQFLFTYGHYTSLQERLVYQLDNPSLESGIGLLEPGNSDYICGYVHLLQAKYPAMQQPGIPETTYRHTVWLVVYAWLLNRRGSRFDRKSFLAQTIARLAVLNNLTYEHLLDLVTRDLAAFTDTLSLPPELFALLAELRKELAEQTYGPSAAGTARYYQAVANLLRKETIEHLSPSLREQILFLLSRPESARPFLQQLQEAEIIRLVPVVFPSDSAFVIETAHALDCQHEQGALQGHTGGEFRLLKWHLIPPLLLGNGRPAYTRRWFVEQLIRQIAAHYNLAYVDLLHYMIHTPAWLALLDTPLRLLITELHTRATSDKQDKQTTQELQPDAPDAAVLISRLSRPEPLSPDEHYAWKQALSHTPFLRTVLAAITEDQRLLLNRFLFPAESDFIAAYAHSLDHAHSQGVFKGDTGHGFARIKWEFIFIVLLQMPGETVNRRTFVVSVLQQLAAHYNLRLREVLAWLHAGRQAVLASFPAYRETAAIIDALYYREIFGFSLTTEEEHLIDILVASHPDWLDLLLRAANGRRTVSASEWEQLWSEITNRLTSHQQEVFRRIISHLAPPAIQQKINNPGTGTTRPDKNQPVMQTPEMISDNQSNDVSDNAASFIYVNNAGIVLVVPYFTRLFNMLKLTVNNKFTGIDAQIRAACLIRIMTNPGKGFPEAEMQLNKLFAGLPANHPIPSTFEPTQEETEAIQSLLSALLQNWPKLKRTSVEAFRDAFLLRNGRFEVKENDNYDILTVEEKAYDLLLDSCPWNFRTLRLPWMPKVLQVKWR